jgi:putative ABC transport system ATP-binding protein
VPQNSKTQGPKLRTEHLSRKVDGLQILEDINIEVQPKEVVAITGPSGSGKTSLLRLLNRLDEPTEGTVYLDGQDYRQIPPRELRQRVGMVMQFAHLFPGTVADNIRFGPLQRGETISDKKIEALLEQVGLAGFAGRDISRLSGGEGQRVSLARTLANQPEVLLLDEPTSALDQAAEKDVEALLRRIFQETGLTCLIVTHDLAQAGRLADRAIVLVAGRVAKMGPVEEVIHA